MIPLSGHLKTALGDVSEPDRGCRLEASYATKPSVSAQHLQTSEVSLLKKPGERTGKIHTATTRILMPLVSPALQPVESVAWQVYLSHSRSSSAPLTHT